MATHWEDRSRRRRRRASGCDHTRACRLPGAGLRTRLRSVVDGIRDRAVYLSSGFPADRELGSIAPTPRTRGGSTVRRPSVRSDHLDLELFGRSLPQGSASPGTKSRLLDGQAVRTPPTGTASGSPHSRWLHPSSAPTCCFRSTSAGEKHRNVDLGHGHKLESLWLTAVERLRTLEYIASANVVLSLQHSPHPSHPPFDAAISGARAVTNEFYGTRAGLHPDACRSPT